MHREVGGAKDLSAPRYRFTPEQAMEAPGGGGAEVYPYTFLNLGARLGLTVNATPGTLNPQ
jgi:hypothetical protein